MLTTQEQQQREEAFQRYLEMSAPYFEAVDAAGDEPWFGSEADRRELFMRRYRSPVFPNTHHQEIA